MDLMFPFLIFGAFVVLMAILAFFSYQAQQQRQAELTALAQQINWPFVANEVYTYDSEFSQFDCFCRGHSRHAHNTFQGVLQIGGEACPARMGDYHYKTTSHDKDGKSHTHNHDFSYLLVQLPYGTTPNLTIRHEGIFDTVKGAFGFRDINFESAEFSKRFHVTSADKKFAYDVVHPAMMEFLLAAETPTIEIADGQCCLTNGEDSWSAAQFEQRRNFAVQFLELWPKHLVASLRNS